MRIKNLEDQISVSDQICTSDLADLAEAGVKVIINNRPDHEAADQPDFEAIRDAAKPYGIVVVHVPVQSMEISAEHIKQFIQLLSGNQRVHAYCRTGNRSSNLWAAVRASQGVSIAELKAVSGRIGIDLSKGIGSSVDISDSINHKQFVDMKGVAKPCYEVVVVGAGAAGIAAAASLLKRMPDIRMALIEPSEDHYYQPGWTMVGGGVFNAESTHRKTKDLIPSSVVWLKQSVTSFVAAEDRVILSDGQSVYYRHLIVCPGLKLNWQAVEGLPEALGKNGVTSNYRHDLAPYTWSLVEGLKSGKALFTQPPMPIKCAGAPQKALYLSADYWQRSQCLNNIGVHFYNAGPVLFGVKDFVPALQSYIDRYQASTHFSHNLIKIDGEQQQAWFKTQDSSGDEHIIQADFDMIHVCPPQCAPDFVANSDLVDEAGWLEVDMFTLQHVRHENIWGLGDIVNCPNAKTMGAARKQAPVVAQNICDALHKRPFWAGYDGYGSCPLTVERGKVVLAEFSYGGKLAPAFPSWLLSGTKATTLGWILKANLLPAIYWHAMLKGREWFAKPQRLGRLDR